MSSTKRKAAAVVVALLLLGVGAAVFRTTRAAAPEDPEHQRADVERAASTPRRRRITTHGPGDAPGTPAPAHSAAETVEALSGAPHTTPALPPSLQPEAARVLVRGPDGKPVAGALVEVRVPGGLDEPGDWASVLASMLRTKEPTESARTDADGGVELRTPSLGYAEVRVEKDGFAPANTGMRLIGNSTIDVQLTESHVVEGDVVGMDGEAREGIVVLLSQERKVFARTQTDAHGRFVFGTVAPRTYDAWISWPDGLPVRVGTVRVPLARPPRFTLPGGGTVNGTIVDDTTREPLEGVRVLGLGVNGHLGMAMTDANGRYSLDVLGRGPIQRLATWKAGYAKLSHRDMPLPIERGQVRERDFSLYRGGKLVGFVRGPDGPVEGARVLLWVGDREKYITHKSTHTDAAGRYEIEAIRPGLALVEVHRRGLRHAGIPSEGTRYAALLDEKLDERCSATIVDGAEARLDVTLERVETPTR